MGRRCRMAAYAFQISTKPRFLPRRLSRRAPSVRFPSRWRLLSDPHAVIIGHYYPSIFQANLFAPIMDDFEMQRNIIHNDHNYLSFIKLEHLASSPGTVPKCLARQVLAINQIGCGLCPARREFGKPRLMFEKCFRCNRVMIGAIGRSTGLGSTCQAGACSSDATE